MITSRCWARRINGFTRRSVAHARYPTPVGAVDAVGPLVSNRNTASEAKAQHPPFLDQIQQVPLLIRFLLSTAICGTDPRPTSHRAALGKNAAHAATHAPLRCPFGIGAEGDWPYYLWEGRTGRGRGSCPLLHGHQLNPVLMVAGVAVCPARAARASASVMVDFHLLQSRHMRCVLPRSSGDPPLTLGMSSSTTGDLGCHAQPVHSVRAHLGPCLPAMYLSVLLTVMPQSAQLVSSASTRRMSSRRLCPLALAAPMRVFLRI